MATAQGRIGLWSDQGVQLVQAPAAATVAPVTALSREDAARPCRVMGFSANGRYFAWATTERVVIASAETGETILPIERVNVVALAFSPKGSFIATWQRPAADGSQQPNAFITSVPSGQLVESFFQRRLEHWEPQWTADESLMARQIGHEVHFFDAASPQQGPKQRLVLENLASFKLSPSAPIYRVIAYVPSIKGAPAYVRMYQYPNFSNPAALSSKSFYRADSIKVHWNPQGTGALICTETDVDATGKSYYGETHLYFLSGGAGFDCAVPLNKEGAIHSVAWNPNGKEFVVVYGYMPAHAMIFDIKANPLFDFGSGPRNTVSYSPHGNLICLAGFGNLRGDMVFWDRKNLRIASQVLARDTTVFEWFSDSEHFLTATTSPRLRVANGFKIWHYKGKVLAEQDFKELWDIRWRPLDVASFPEKPVVTGTLESKYTKAASTYVPPHLRGSSAPPPTLKLHELAPAKRIAPVHNSTASNSTNGASGSAKNGSKIAAAQPETPDEIQKKIKVLNKKLKAIQDLKDMQKEGKQLEANQIDKIKTERDIAGEIEKLQRLAI